MSIAKASLQYSGLFEAELLVELMLRYWKHPLADDQDFRNRLLESAVEALHAAASGHELIQGLQPQNTNLVAAIWYAETNSPVTSQEEEESLGHTAARQEWRLTVRHVLPSCFCNPEMLD